MSTQEHNGPHFQSDQAARTDSERRVRSVFTLVRRIITPKPDMYYIRSSEGYRRFPLPKDTREQSPGSDDRTSEKAVGGLSSK